MKSKYKIERINQAKSCFFRKKMELMNMKWKLMNGKTDQETKKGAQSTNMQNEDQAPL